jgi:radical SAM-linked protein
MKYRLKFSKSGRASFISHLDLMRTFQRAFLRADIALRRSEGFNPHPLMSIALPLSVGQESVCELIDFETEGVENTSTLPARVTAAMPEGIEILTAEISGSKFAKIKWIDITGELIYDDGVPDDALLSLREYFAAETLIIPKKTKRGTADFDLKSGIASLKFSSDGEKVSLRAFVSANDPTVNPALIIDALEFSEDSQRFAPSFASFRRIELYDEDFRQFR